VNFGDFTIPDQVHVWETLVVTNVSGVIPAGSNIKYSLATVTMPWSGYLDASFYHAGSYNPAIMGVSCWPYGSPAPTQFFAGSNLESSTGGAWMHIPYMAQWTGLAKGTVVNFGIEVQCNVGNVSWNAGMFAGSLRAFRD
jgi:hypothetical protein